MHKSIFFIFYFLIIGLYTYANDTSGTVLPTGGVVFEKQDGIRMVTEALYIRPGQIEVNYLFKNTTDKDITTQVFFPLPEMPAVQTFPQGDLAHDYRFKLWVNQKPTHYQTHWSTTQDGQDITADTSALFVRPEEFITERELHNRIQKLSADKQKILQDKKIIHWDWILDYDKGETEVWAMAGEKEWQKQISYYWEQTFPAGQTVHIRHTYTPTGMTTNVGTPFSECVAENSEKYQEFIYIPKNERKYSWEHLNAQEYVEYILTTANNWQGPIENFNLLVESPLKSVGCFDGKEFYAEKYFAVNRQNYTPEWDISVDFIENGYMDFPYRPKNECVLYRVDGPANVRLKPNGKVLGQMENDTYVWVWPDEKKGKWYPVLQNDLWGYTHAQNLIKVF